MQVSFACGKQHPASPTVDPQQVEKESTLVNANHGGSASQFRLESQGTQHDANGVCMLLLDRQDVSHMMVV